MRRLSFCKHLEVDVLNGFKPRHTAVVDMMGLIVEHREFVYFPDDFPEIGFALGGFCRQVWGRTDRENNRVDRRPREKDRARRPGRPGGYSSGKGCPCREGPERHPGYGG